MNSLHAGDVAPIVRTNLFKMDKNLCTSLFNTIIPMTMLAI